MKGKYYNCNKCRRNAWDCICPDVSESSLNNLLSSAPLTAIRAANDVFAREVRELRLEKPCPVANVVTSSKSIKQRERFIAELQGQVDSIDAWLREVVSR